MSDAERLRSRLEERGIASSCAMRGELTWSAGGVTFVAVVRDGTGEVILTAYPLDVDAALAATDWIEEREGQDERRNH